jgi:hypothetical protein
LTPLITSYHSHYLHSLIRIGTIILRIASRRSVVFSNTRIFKCIHIITPRSLIITLTHTRIGFSICIISFSLTFTIPHGLLSLIHVLGILASFNVLPQGWWTSSLRSFCPEHVQLATTPPNPAYQYFVASLELANYFAPFHFLLDYVGTWSLDGSLVEFLRQGRGCAGYIVVVAIFVRLVDPLGFIWFTG